MNIKDCPFCGASQSVQKKTSPQEFEYKGQKIIIENYVSYECSKCGESFETPEDNRDNEQKVLAFRRSVDGLLSPDEIRNLRKSLGFTQKKFAEFLGVGEKSFTRYERGTVVQGRAMDNLLRLIKNNPGESVAVLSEAQAGQHHCENVKFTLFEKIETRATGTDTLHGGYSLKSGSKYYSWKSL